LQAFGARLQPAGARCFAAARPSAMALLRIAAARWPQGAAVDAALALPLYVRDKVAQTTAEREAARLARLEATP
jgi:tRNA threonylcarbamoyladenosine biosynthesis protein TsaB